MSARDQLLAGAALAGDQHGRTGIGDALDNPKHLLHRRADADDVAHAVAAGELAAQIAVLLQQLEMLQGAFHVLARLLVVNGFCR